MTAAALLFCGLLAAGAGGTRAADWLRATDLGGLETRSAALVLSGEEGGELEVSVLPFPLGRGPDRLRVALVIDVEDEDPPEPSPGDGPNLTEIYVYALDGAGAISDFLAQGFVLDAGERRGVKFFGHLDLAPGRYSLRVLVERRSEERMGLRVLPFEVPPGDANQPPELATEPAEPWVLVRQAASPEEDGGDFPVLVGGMVPATRARPPADSAAADLAPTVPNGDGAGARRRELVESYAEALRHLAASDPGGARAALAALERSAFDNGAQSVLATYLLGFASRLAAIDSESLVPLIQLHEKVYREHHRRRQYLYATHSRQMLIGLGAIYAGHSRSGESGGLIADAFASLGGYLQELGSALAAEAAYQEALKYDAEHEASLLGLATVHEAYGDHQQAADLLKRLLDKHPGNAEAKLRRAVCLERLGTAREAKALYREALEAPDEWIRAVAYQELANLLVAEKRLQEAEALLLEAVEALPGVQRLYLQLAAVYDRMNRPAAARDALARLDPRSGRDADSPRLVFSRWPSHPIEATRRALAAAADSRLGTLSAALDKAAGPGD